MSTLRVLAYNICLGGADRVEAIGEVLAHVNADVVALTDADDERVVTTLADRLGMHHIWARGSGDRHIATLSRFPIAEWHVYNTPPLTQAVLETQIELPHPLPFSPDGDPSTSLRSAQDAASTSLRSAQGAAGWRGEVVVFNVHLLPYLLLPFEIRRWQAVGKLLEVIRGRRPGAHLILGDLNAIAPGDRVLQRNNPPRMRRVMRLQFNLIFRLAVPRLIRAGYLDCFRRMHPNEAGFTWMPGNRTTRYDYILADPILAHALRACRVVDDIAAVNVASDHFPLMAEFELDSLAAQELS